ncbi:hypothetical protein BKA93DRAFT_799399 [Sparassis latifolia]
MDLTFAVCQCIELFFVCFSYLILRPLLSSVRSSPLLSFPSSSALNPQTLLTLARYFCAELSRCRVSVRPTALSRSSTSSRHTSVSSSHPANA